MTSHARLRQRTLTSLEMHTLTTVVWSTAAAERPLQTMMTVAPPTLSTLLWLSPNSNKIHVYIHCVHEKNGPPKHVQKSSKVVSFAQLQFNSMNICLFSIKLPILVENLSYRH